MNTVTRQGGYTLVELMIAIFLTGLLAMAGLQYYVHIHNQTLTQEDIGDMQLAARNSLDEMTKTLSLAGYKIPDTHNPFEISGDTLKVFFSGTQPVDTVAYFLRASQLDADHPSYMLMRKENSGPAMPFTDNIVSLNYRVLAPSVVDITILVQTDRADEEYTENGGIRDFSLTERVQMRNLKL